MRPASIYGLRPRCMGIAACCLLLAGCGQTGALYLVTPPAAVPQATTRAAPVPSTAPIPAAPAAVTATPPPGAATHGQP